MRRMSLGEHIAARARSALRAAVVVVASGMMPSVAFAQIASDTTGLGARYGRMSMLLEKTFLKVDVLELEIRTDSVTSAGIAAALDGGDGDGAARAEIARLVVNAPELWARMTFERDVGVERLIQEIRNSMRKAVEAGMLEARAFDVISGSLPEWYASLGERGVRDGDAQYYRISGDTLRTMYIGRDGETYIDATATTPANRTALLASWFAPGSDFRDKLLASLPRS